MLNIVILLGVSSVLSDIDPCYPTGGPCTKYQDCPKNWACVDDTFDPDKPHQIHGICVGNKRLDDCSFPQGIECRI